MARKDRPKLTPIHELSPEKQYERRWARKHGFRDENQLHRLIDKLSSYPESDVRYLHPAFQGEAFEAEVLRLRKVAKRVKSPAKVIQRKYRVLTKTLNKMSAFNFRDRYLEAITRLLQDPSTSSYDKEQLRKMMKEINQRMSVPREMGPGEQGELFG